MDFFAYITVQFSFIYVM